MLNLSGWGHALKSPKRARGFVKLVLLTLEIGLFGPLCVIIHWSAGPKPNISQASDVQLEHELWRKTTFTHTSIPW